MSLSLLQKKSESAEENPSPALMSRDKSVDLTEVLSYRATLFECLRHNLLSLRQVPMMWRHKPDLFNT